MYNVITFKVNSAPGGPEVPCGSLCSNCDVLHENAISKEGRWVLREYKHTHLAAAAAAAAADDEQMTEA